MLSENKDKINTALAPFEILNLKDNFSPIRKDTRLYRLYDLFTSMQGNHIPFPNGIKESHVAGLGSILVNIWAGLYYRSESICRKSIGRFLPEWTHNIAEAQAGRHYQRLSIFSGHDTTLQPVLSSMQVHIGEYPGYASNVILKLKKGYS